MARTARSGCSRRPPRTVRGPRSRWPSTATGAGSPPTRTAAPSRQCSSARPTSRASVRSRAVAGLGDACRALGVPVVGGNVSLYNEGGGGPIYPTPVVGLVGELPDARRSGRLGFQNTGDVIAIVAADSWAPSNAASELSKLRGEAVEGPLPHVELGELKALHAAIRQAVRSGALSSAHD